jgi:membrane-bound lytic murein transglycosylase A
MRFSLKKYLPLLLVLFVTACATGTSEGPQKELVLKSSSFSSMDGWNNDDFKGFMDAYTKSCARILKRSPNEKFAANPVFGTYGPWQENCRKAQSVNGNDTAAVRSFIENNFKVMEASAGGNTKGLFTGYYESTLNGSRTKHGPYQHPLLARPDDLVMVDLGEFREELKGQRIAGRVIGGSLKPFESREQIVSGKLKDAKPIVWLDDPHDAFFVQVQGSGVVHLDDGSTMRVGYAGQNGHVYYAIGRELVKRGIYSKEDVSMESITRWMRENPAKADELMNTNKSYVFFTEMPDDGSGAGPQGGEGIKLTAQRSLAIDRSIIPYGFPVYLSADVSDLSGKPFKRLMMAQDTGGAIRGPVRGDVFWGAGAAAEAKAGPMKAQGRYWFLIPKSVN